MQAQHIAGLPNGNYSFETWDDGTYYTMLDTETKTVYGYINEMQSCECCSYPRDYDWNWDDLNEETQKLIIDEITEKYKLIQE